jgi:heme-degrading monooxygenase HmoA
MGFNQPLPRGATMTIKVFIKRRYPSTREQEILPLLKELRVCVPRQKGYIASEYLKRTDVANEMAVLSTWNSLEDWKRWFNSKERYAIQSKIEAIPGVSTEYSVYTY